MKKIFFFQFIHLLFIINPTYIYLYLFIYKYLFFNISIELVLKVLNIEKHIEDRIEEKE